MQTLASILAGAGGNPYQGAGGGISPLVQQLMLAQQMGGPQIGEAPQPGAQPQMPPQGQQPIPGQPQLPGLGSMAGGLPALMASGAY